MPELPEVEVLARHLDPLLRGRKVVGATVNRLRVLGRTAVNDLQVALMGRRFAHVSRRGKYLVFDLQKPGSDSLLLVGHLGMTGRMYLLGNHETLPKHAAVVLDLGKARFIFEDTRYFGKLSLDTSPLSRLGPEPLDPKWRAVDLLKAVRKSRRPIKTVLLDQAVVAGIGNIYASEALFRAGIDPRQPANRVAPRQAQRLWRSIRSVLRDAIRCGSTIPLRFSGSPDGDGFFYFGKAEGASEYHTERLRVYDRHRLPCRICRGPIARIVQASRSTFFCPRCQPKQRTISASTIRGSS